MPAILWTNSLLSEISADLAEIRAAHIDILYSYLLLPATPDADMQAYLNALDAAGLKAMLSVRELGKNVVMGRQDKVLSAGELATLAAYVDKWKTHPAVWGWYADDEGTAAYPIATRQQVYDTVKTHHPAGRVFEVHQAIIPGVYSPAVHDVFALDIYVYAYDDQPAGCISKATGLVTNTTVETAVINDLKTRMDGFKATLDAAGETDYLLTMQAVGHSAEGANYVLAMPPTHGIERMWSAVQDAGWDDYGVGWFLWKSNDAFTMPGENLTGVGEAPNKAVLVAEISAIAATVPAEAPVVGAPAVKTHTLAKVGDDVIGGGFVTADGGHAVTVRGICWNLTGAPTTAGSHTTDAGTTGLYSSALPGLFPDTTCHVRAYATNSQGTSYGADIAYSYPGPETAVGPAPPRAIYSVVITDVNGANIAEDITEIVDMDTLHRFSTERGEASATIDIPVASENEIPVNGLVRDAAVKIVVDGTSEWLGHVVAVHKPKPQDLSYVLDCAGGWDTLHHHAPWCKGFVETRYDGMTEYPPSPSSPWVPCTAIDVSTDGEVLLTLPKGTKLKAPQAKCIYLHILGGLATGFSIERITCDVATSGTGVLFCDIWAGGPNPFSFAASSSVFGAATDAYSAAIDTGDISADGPLTVLQFRLSALADVAEQTDDQTFQVRNIRAYVDRTTAPRVDEIVAAIDAEVRPDAPAAATEAVGPPLTAFMCDPFTTPAEGIAVALTKAAIPPLCGVFQNQLVIKNRPTSPPIAARFWTVSEQLTPGLEWGVEVDEEQSVDYVGVSYAIIGDATLPDGTPQIAYFPSAPPNAAVRTGLIDGGDLTAAEAAAAAQQAYAYLHALASGPVVIPYVVQDAYGNERPADVIRVWDWVQNVGSLDAETAGPFLVSEVEHQGHIATLTIGAAEAYAYNGPDRMPTKGRYVGAHRVRSRTTTRVSFAKYWAWKHREDKRKPKMPKRHAKYGTIRGYKWTDVEGRYT